MNIRYRRADMLNLDRLLVLVSEFYAFEHLVFDLAKARKVLTDLIQNEEYGRIWLIMLDDVLIGYVVITLGYSVEYHGCDAFVDELFLREPYRGQGVGTQTLTFLEVECRQLKVKALHLEVLPENRRAYDLYHRLGYIDRQSSLLTKRL